MLGKGIRSKTESRSISPPSEIEAHSEVLTYKANFNWLSNMQVERLKASVLLELNKTCKLLGGQQGEILFQG